MTKRQVVKDSLTTQTGTGDCQYPHCTCIWESGEGPCNVPEIPDGSAPEGNRPLPVWTAEEVEAAIIAFMAEGKRRHPETARWPQDYDADEIAETRAMFLVSLHAAAMKRLEEGIPPYWGSYHVQEYAEKLGKALAEASEVIAQIRVGSIDVQ